MSSSPLNPDNSSDLDHLDLNLNQVRETVTMLCLAIAQIKCTMTDGDTSIESLGSVFSDISKSVNTMRNAARDAQSGASSELAEQIIERTNLADRSLSSAVTSLQFYDRVSQRLDHVTQGLHMLGDLLGDCDRRTNPKAWEDIQNEVKESYSLDCERLMYEQIMLGATIEEALELYRHNFNNLNDPKDDSDDEIELF